MQKHQKTTTTPTDSPPTKNILLVEDNWEAIQAHSDALYTIGYHADAVTQCRSALTKLTKGYDYDIVLIDIDVPDLMMGELVAFIQQQKGEKTTKIMALTTRGINIPMVKACLNSGIKNIIPKPFSVDFLLALLEEEDVEGLESVFDELF